MELIRQISQAFGLLAEIIGGFITVLALLYFGRYWWRTQKMRRFFGQDRAPKLIIYLSTLWIPQFSSVDPDGVPRSFKGPALPTGELSAVADISRMFETEKLNIPRRIRPFVDSLWPLKPVTLIFSPSPRQEKDIEFENIIAVGSFAYNTASRYYQRHGNPYLKIQDGVQGILIDKGPRKGEVIAPTSDLAILERMIDETWNRVIFHCAGLGVNGTLGAVRYLSNHWEEMYNRYGRDGAFAYVMECPWEHQDPKGYQKPIVKTVLPKP